LRFGATVAGAAAAGRWAARGSTDAGLRREAVGMLGGSHERRSVGIQELRAFSAAGVSKLESVIVFSSRGD
jgi:hypothetical protein